jgi:hypothetical protein
MTEVTTLLDYVSTPIPESGIFKFSPSSFAKFVERPHVWYREEVLGEDKFTYNTASVLGTIIHYCAQYVGMAEKLVNDYVLERPTFLKIEEQFCAEVKDDFYAAGTLDVLEGEKDDCMITDYKSYSSKTKPKTIPAHYKYQLLVYAWILRSLGYTVNRLRLVYINRDIEGEISEVTGKRKKSYPPEVTVLTETIEEESFDFIEGLLNLAVDSCLAGHKHPELVHVIWHDPRLAP